MSTGSGAGIPRSLGLRAGELVEVRSREEILSTLDADGRLDAQPFMPEMLEHCGRQFRVRASAHKTCDTVDHSGARRMEDTVHLEDLRCSGQHHGGCQAECLLFWKEAWLKRASDAGSGRTAGATVSGGAGCSEERLFQATSHVDHEGETCYSCQATQLVEASFPVDPRDPRPYWRDLRSGNVSAGELANALFFRFVSNTIQHIGYRLLIGLYNQVQKLWGGVPYPVIRGRVKGRTPKEVLGLQPGERVRVKSLAEIEKTIDARQKNRGMRFDWEMVNYCGQEMVVHSSVDQIINEKTGRMMQFSNPCIILEGGVCPSRFSDRGRIACPRAIYSYFRENWLERIDEPGSGPVTASGREDGPS
ncbi:MAG: hypothetical protein ACQGVK_16435 [Myxococcota bacterium]